MALRGIYQTGYVTRNIERAIPLVGAGFGLSEFSHFEGELALQTPDVANLAMPTVFETEAAGIASVFVDARACIGHHLEFVCATPEGWAMLGWPKGMT